MCEDRKSGRRERQPNQIANDEARNKRPDALQTVAENARDERGDARTRRRDGNEVYAGENQQGGNRHDKTFPEDRATRITGPRNRRGQVVSVDAVAGRVGPAWLTFGK